MVSDGWSCWGVRLDCIAAKCFPIDEVVVVKLKAWFKGFMVIPLMCRRLYDGMGYGMVMGKGH